MQSWVDILKVISECLFSEICIYLIRFLHCSLNCTSQWMQRPFCLIQLSGVQVKQVQLLMNSDLINYHSHQLIDWVSVKLCSIFCNSLVGHLRVTICRFLQRKESSVLFFFLSFLYKKSIYIYLGDEGRANTVTFQSRGLIWIQWPM